MDYRANYKYYGKGIFEKGDYLATENSKSTKYYRLWTSMLKRCYSEDFQIKYPTYKGCFCSDLFLNFQGFSKWCDSQVGFNLDGFKLDKDILIRGNKEYSENNCVFVPNIVNTLLVTRKAKRGVFPVGVTRTTRGKYLAQGSFKSKTNYVGVFDTIDEAFIAYKRNKESLIKVVAEDYRHLVDARVTKALLEYKVDIAD